MFRGECRRPGRIRSADERRPPHRHSKTELLHSDICERRNAIWAVFVALFAVKHSSVRSHRFIPGTLRHRLRPDRAFCKRHTRTCRPPHTRPTRSVASSPRRCECACTPTDLPGLTRQRSAIYNGIAGRPWRCEMAGSSAVIQAFDIEDLTGTPACIRTAVDRKRPNRGTHALGHRPHERASTRYAWEKSTPYRNPGGSSISVSQ